MTTTFHPPGAGEWKRDDSHLRGGMTPYLAEVYLPACLRGFAAGFKAVGAPLAGFDHARIHGRDYLRPRIVGAPRQAIWGDTPPARLPGPQGAPPRAILRLLFVLHPELRRRKRRAAEVFATRAWRHTVAHWRDTLRPAAIAENRRLGAVQLDVLSAADLADHVREVGEALARGIEQHFIHAASFTVPLGDFLVQFAAATGEPAARILRHLRGASPATRETAETLRAIASGLDARQVALLQSGRPPAEIVAELRQVPALAAHLELHGQRTVSGVDLHDLTLDELPEVVVSGLVSALDTAGPPPPAPDPQVSPELASALAEARLVYAVRDDDVSILGGWRLGLLRRALLAAGRELVRAGRLADPSHTFDCSVAELDQLLREGRGPAASVLAERRAERARLDALDPPVALGPPSPPPPAEHFPPAVARLTRAVNAFLTAMDTGTGVGASPGVYEGRARLVLRPEDMARVAPGDVVVAPHTSPLFNVILGMAGAVVTDRGGTLSHAAIIARELGLPCVVSTGDATRRIPDGALVRVDGDRGTVEVLAREAPARASAASKASVVEIPRPEGPGRVVALRQASDPSFGGKARALAAALTAELPVPDGLALDDAMAWKVAHADAAACQAVLAAAASLGEPLAVRSSGVGEDGAQASFAGQHATVLGVRGSEALLQAIATVHASATSAGALAYRARKGIGGVPRMGVVVQRLLPAEISGVLFSHDPTASRPGRVVEATWGLGEALVSGLVTPDRYRVGTDGTVLERSIGDKDQVVLPDGRTVPLAAERRRVACLDDAQLASLAGLASRCEAVFGGPQDLEWAVAGGQLHLLQSRPVTT